MTDIGALRPEEQARWATLWREYLAFYRTTLGKKVLASESMAVEDGFKRAQEWSNEFSDLVLSKFRAEMRKRGYDL